jgi:hypothetical protein
MNVPRSSAPRRRLLHVLAVAPLLMFGAEIASIFGSRAQALSFPFAPFIYITPLTAVVAYFVGGLFLRRRLGAFAWGVSFVLAIEVTNVPRLIVTRYTQARYSGDSIDPLVDSRRNDCDASSLSTSLRALLI